MLVAVAAAVEYGQAWPALGSERWCQIDRQCLFTVMLAFFTLLPHSPQHITTPQRPPTPHTAI
jgi:hypothetical protein